MKRKRPPKKIVKSRTRGTRVALEDSIEAWPLLEEAIRATNIIGKAFFENPEGPPIGPTLAQRYFAAARSLIAAGKRAEAPTS